MLSQERYELILDLLNKKEIVKMKKIIEELGISESTARRDLNYLEEKGLLIRVHGGAKLTDKDREEDFETKNVQKQSEKKGIGRYAGGLVEEGDCIYIDAGTTTEAVIPYLKAENIKVVTNGTTHIGLLSKLKIPTYIIQGNIKHKTGAIVGSDAVKSLRRFYFDKCFLGVNGIHLERGYTTPDTEEAELKEEVIKNSKRAYILADDSKFGKSSFVKFAELDECIIITDKLLVDEYRKLTVVKECKE